MVTGVQAEGSLGADEWATPREGKTLVRMQPLVNAVADLQRTPDSRLVIQYPGGEEGILWARELSSWLVALGIPSRRIDLLPGSRQDDALDLKVR